MTPIDFRNHTWHSLHSQLSGLRRGVWLAWINHGPGTTREVAHRAGIDILAFRPRSTELFQLGLLFLASQHPAKEGIYQARSMAEWQAWFADQQRQFAQSAQPLLNLYPDHPPRSHVT